MIIPSSERVFIINGKRTPFGKFGGALRDIQPVELSLFAAKALITDINLSPDCLDQVIFSNVIPSTPDTLYAGRHLGLKLGMKQETTGLVINRLCGSGIQALIDGCRLIKTNEAQALMIAGSENMSLAPHLTYGGRFGTKYGGLKNSDLLLETLTDKYIQLPMGQTAENLALEYNISKDESDHFSYKSHLKANSAYDKGLIQPEIVAVKLENEDCYEDEHLRKDISLKEIQKLKPTFKKDGIVTPGSASGIVDGACAIVIASEKFVKKHKLSPIAEIISGEVIGVDPAKMGIGPVPATRNLLKKCNLSIDSIDLFEINEAFAPQVVACQKELNIPDDRLNVWGGAIAMGHPLGATGLKITLTLARQLQHYKKLFGISSACIGGGQGIALLIKRV